MKGLLIALILLVQLPLQAETLRGTGDMGVIIERASGSVKIIETTTNSILGSVEGLGDLSHASVVYSRDARYAYVFGRDGALSKVDLLTRRLVKRVMQSGNSIGGAISQDGRLIAVSNYKPGGVKIFDADSLDLLLDLPATWAGSAARSKVVGLVDAPGQKFVFSLWDAGEIWVVDVSDINNPQITKYRDIGRNPYDGLISPNGRYYIAGLFGEDGLAKLDLWHPEQGVKRILPHYGKGEQKLPVYKMPHLEGWAIAGNYAYVPAVGRHEVLVINLLDWREAGRIKVHGQPVFVMTSPDQRQVWVNFAVPNNEAVQVIDTQTLKIVSKLVPGKGVLHMEFEPRGEQVWISVRDRNQVQIYNTRDFTLDKTLTVKKPSGIFFTDRAHRTGL